MDGFLVALGLLMTAWAIWIALEISQLEIIHWFLF